MAAVHFFRIVFMMFEKSAWSMEFLKARTYTDPLKELKFLKLERSSCVKNVTI